jgi:pimeloyl-ACP methyl ester carboxylesterase
VGSIQSTACAYSVAGETLRCGTLTVPENYARRDGRQITLPYVILPAKSGRPLADPIVYLEGGPGASVVPSIGLNAALGAIRENRDLILLEHRGNPAATPALVCDLGELAPCRADLVAQGIDLEQYNNVNTARDFEMLRRALKIERWNLFGISYGTTLAMYVMRAFPDGVRSVVLDSPTAPGTDIARADVTSQLDGVSRMADRCKVDLACNAAFPDLRARFIDTMNRLDLNPIVVAGTLAQALGTERLDGRAFASSVVRGLQWSASMVRMPALIDAASKRDVPRLSRVLDFSDVPSLSLTAAAGPEAFGLLLSIYCGELHYSRMDEGPDPTVEVWPDAVWRNLVPEYYTACKEGVWPIKPIDRSLMDQVNSKVPTLILLGALDPITSITEARRAIAGLEKGFLITVPETTHGAVDEPCALAIMAQFLDGPTVSPDQGCLASIPRSRYRVDL